jgi:hypothetical protein
MLEKAAKISNLVQGIAALVFLYSYFFPPSAQQVIRSGGQAIGHPTWLPVASIVFLAASVVTASVLNFVFQRQMKKIEATIPSISVNNVPVAGPVREPVKSKPKLIIHRAVYGTGPITDIDITESLRNAARDGLVIPVDNNLVPRDPAVGIRKRLVVDYSYGNGIVCSASRAESIQGDIVRLVLPEDSEIQRLSAELKKRIVEGALTETKAAPLLRDRIFNACRELQMLLEKHGKRPNPYLIPISDRDEYIRKYTDEVQAWDDKFQADYWRNHNDKIVALRHELAQESLTDNAPDRQLKEAETSELSDVTVREIDKGLRSLAAKLP